MALIVSKCAKAEPMSPATDAGVGFRCTWGFSLSRAREKCQEEVTTSLLPSVTQQHIFQVKQDELSGREEASRSEQKKALFREKVHENKI